MPDSGLPDDSVLTSAFYDTFVREQVVVTCTSVTRPTPVEGRVIYETDTDRLLVYNGSNWLRAHAVAAEMPARMKAGVESSSTDGSGDVSVTHGLGTTPDVVLVTPSSSNVSQGRVVGLNATTFTYRCFNATGTAQTSTAVAFHWLTIDLA